MAAKQLNGIFCSAEDLTGTLWKSLESNLAIRFIHNSRAKKTGIEKLKSPLTTSEILYSRDFWIRKMQRHIPEDTQCSGWRETRKLSPEMCWENSRLATSLSRKWLVCRETYLLHSRAVATFGNYQHHGRRSRRMEDSSVKIIGKQSNK